MSFLPLALRDQVKYILAGLRFTLPPFLGNRFLDCFSQSGCFKNPFHDKLPK